MIISPDLRGELARGVSIEFLKDVGQLPAFVEADATADALHAETLGQELGRIAEVLDVPEVRELTTDEEKEVDRGWTTPASIRAATQDSS
jgi:hypothetical protein